MTGATGRVPGMFTLVLHTHLPWLAHHGVWPVGEELLYQAWGQTYLPLAEVLEALSAEGYTDLLSLGLTPIVTAQLDDPYVLEGMHHWLGNWRLRAAEALTWSDEPSHRRTGRPGTAIAAAGVRQAGAHEWELSGRALASFERWRHGGSPVLRGLIDSGVIELLGGPLAHPFQPLIPRNLRRFSLDQGLADAELRLGRRPQGIWAPECAFTAGMEEDYAAAGVSHFLVDGPAIHGETALGRPVAGSDVVAFARDLAVAYEVWSPTSGYPGHPAYRDFHALHHPTGLKTARVTGRDIAAEHKAPYDPIAADRAIDGHVEAFVELVSHRLREQSERIGRPAHVVAAFDTELFGHWWHEGPTWLARVLRALPEAGVTVGTLESARAEGYVGDPIELGDVSWGTGKDWRVWNGPQVADLATLNSEIVAELDAAMASSGRPDTTDPSTRASKHGGATDDDGAPHRGDALFPRDRVADQILREAILELESDWAFLVSKDTAADYARHRAHTHAHALREIAAARDRGDETESRRLAAAWGHADNPFPQLDARRYRPAGAGDAG